MTTKFSKVLLTGEFFKGQDGVFHLVRKSDSDVVSKLLNGCVSEFGFLSAIREVADGEIADGFTVTKSSYEAIAKAVQSLADLDGISEFALQYRQVADLVLEYAQTLV